MVEAKNKLTQLIQAVEKGETVTVCRHGVPVVDIVRSSQGSGAKRKLGTARGKLEITDPEWWKPMNEEEAAAFIEGRD
jgi:antitoxin (DNA-binding transcriptional repressor) of toxin-antitoxin stability system